MALALAHRGQVDLDGRNLAREAFRATCQRRPLLAGSCGLLVKLGFMGSELVLAVGEFLDIRAACGGILGKLCTTLVDLVLFLQLLGNRLLEAADFLAQTIGLTGNLRNGLRKLEVIGLGNAQVVERFVNIALALHDGFDGFGLLLL